VEKPDLGDRARQSVTKKKIRHRRNINAIRAFFAGKKPTGIAIGLFQPKPGQRE
jgi:hypothetical protein